MEIQVATLCDYATDYGGKLCVMGTFDTIAAHQLPVIHPHCALALRVCFKLGDEGHHKFSIRFIDADGNNVIDPPFEPTIDVSFPNDAYFITRNIIIAMQRLKFERAGHYSIDISANGELPSRIPVRIMQVQSRQQ
jgi:hypothetical protein